MQDTRLTYAAPATVDPAITTPAAPPPSTSRVRLAIAVPTYNEVDAIPALLDALQSQAAAMPCIEAEVLVIDDASPDGTGQLVERLAASGAHPALRIDVLHRPAKEGLGRAYVAGLTRLLDQGRSDLILQMDADLSHQPVHLPSMLDAAKSADLVIGSRYVPGGSTPDWAWHRRAVSHLGNIYARWILGPAIDDYTGGYNLFRSDLLARLDVGSITADGYGFVVELKHTAVIAGATVVQVPITFVDRRVGASKIPRSTIFENLLLVPRLRLRQRGAARPRR